MTAVWVIIGSVQSIPMWANGSPVTRHVSPASIDTKFNAFEFIWNVTTDNQCSENYQIAKLKELRFNVKKNDTHTERSNVTKKNAKRKETG